MPGTAYKEYEHFHSDFLVLNSTLFFNFWNNPIHRDKPVWINKQIAFFTGFQFSCLFLVGFPGVKIVREFFGLFWKKKEKQLLQPYKFPELAVLETSLSPFLDGQINNSTSPW